ncbi:MAG: RNA-binding protein hfq [Gloeomargaritaceae cyanobacterium C42_A2020_066]|nr:RNA-binding protein hfq [Gloeomargaritaceae cyanobacterium C42_A2020_066]
MSELNTDLPSVRFIQSLIRDKTRIEAKLVTGDTLHGRITWQDIHALRLITDVEEVFVIQFHALAYLKNLS